MLSTTYQTFTRPTRKIIEMEEDKNLIRLASFEYEYEAISLRVALNEEGIPAWITGGDGVNTFGAGLTAAGLVGVDVNIRQIDLKAAEKAMEQLQKESKVVMVPAWKCKCGEQVDEGFAVCWSCGAEFEGLVD